MSWELVLPWPSRDLHPNSRGHWSKRAKAAKSAREAALLFAIEAGWHRAEWPEGDLFVWIDFYPPGYVPWWKRRKEDQETEGTQEGTDK